MKNFKKISSILCVLVLTLVASFIGVKSIVAAPSSTTISREGVMVSYIGENYRWAKFKTSDNKVAYCLDMEKTWPEKSTNMSLEKEASAGIKYILENGYPKKSITGNSDVDRFITQGALWWYLADTGQGSLSSDFAANSADPYGLRDKIKALADAAKGAGSTANGSIDVTINSTDMKLSSDGKYYVSDEVTTTLVGPSSYNVSVTGATGAITTDTNGQTKTSFGANEKFLVKVPATALAKTTKINVKVSASDSHTKAYIFKPADGSIQRVVALYDEGDNLEKSLSLTATVNGDRVCVDYVIVGNVKPDPKLTDPTPDKSCYEKGTKYTQEHELTTRQANCKFNGWYTKENLTGKWVNGTALNKDMTLYGAWDCGTNVSVPATAANTPLIILGIGIASIGAGAAVYVYKTKKVNVK